jgi:hypothetical protein
MNFFKIHNAIIGKDFCSNDNTWVNDGRESTMFKSETDAQFFLKEAQDGWENPEKIYVQEIHVDIEE